MRTKTLLMSAAALLAAGIVSSQAQPVYSQNVVGYAAVETPGNGTVNYLITVPFAIGVSNGANEIWPSGTLPDGSQILVWDSDTSSYTVYVAFSGYASGWADAGFAEVPAPTLPVGQGFFLNPFSPITNVFAGTIAVNVGATNNMNFSSANGTINYLVGSAVPYAGAVTNGSASGGGLNLSAAGGLPDGSQMLIWDPNTSSYTVYVSFSGYTSGWADAGFAEVPPPQVSVGQGFFLNPISPFDWQVGL
jgi:hypothetical protein